jgi:RNA polymerase sigma factor for flagellar operon FliA
LSPHRAISQANVAHDRSSLRADTRWERRRRDVPAPHPLAALPAPAAPLVTPKPAKSAPISLLPPVERRAPARRKPARELDPTARLWRQFARRRGSAERNALVEIYQGLVADSVRRFSARLPRSVDTGDLHTAANVGLIAAVESFDRTRGVPFESYCELRVRGALLDELRSQDWLPRPWRARLERHKRAVESLRSRHSREPNESELALELGLSLDDYRTIFTSGLLGAPAGGPSSLPTGYDDDEPGGLEIVPDSLTESPDERLTREDLLALVAQKLTPQEYRIVYLKYWEDLSLREIGELEGLSESRVCKIHMKLLERLQERLRASSDA